jgi:hypothetical protein
MQFAMVKPTDRDCIFVADLAAERARLSKTKVMRFRGCSPADHAGLRGDKFAVLLVTQPDGLGREATRASGRPREKNDWSRS